MTAPAVQRLGASILVQGPALRELQYLLVLGARERQRRDALQASVGVRHLLALLAEAVDEDDPVTRARHGDVAGGADSADSAVMGTPQEITTGEAAAILALGRRQVQRLASSIGARRVPGGAFVFDKLAVAAYAAQRRQRDSA